MNSPIQQQDINNRICPGAPIKRERPLMLCIPRCKIEGNLFPDTEKENVRPTTPPSRKLPNGICYCPLDKCTCCYAPKRAKKSNN
jgi:hypothetical protein